ncbi:MAG: hypothetical protein O0V67_08270 [Methanocorpusculum sp.]|nr:hypothetical protein [Methanocorpusculum sp.]
MRKLLMFGIFPRAMVLKQARDPKAIPIFAEGAAVSEPGSDDWDMIHLHTVRKNIICSYANFSARSYVRLLQT